MSNTIYFDDDKKPRLVQSYCVFADFLGYRHEIKEAVGRGEEEAVFQRFMDEIEPEIENIIQPSPNDDTPGFPRMWDAKVFTDNVVLGYAIWSDHGENEFGHAICQLIEFQMAVALKGFFVRGGWSFGNLFMNRNTVFGASLLDAYELESKVANYPRIILSDDLKDLVFRHMARYGSDPPQCYHLIVDADGLLMTNYLSEVIIEGEVYWEDLDRHAKLIAERLEEHSENDRVLEKYRWLAAYHNFFCAFLTDHEDYSDAILVKGDFPDYGLRQLLREDSPYVAEVQAEAAKLNARLAVC